MQINTNMQAMRGARALTRNNELLGRAIERLSSGERLLRAGDDPGGLAISERMKGQTARLGAARENIQGATSWLQTADGMAAELNGMLTRMSELAMLARDPIKSPEDRALYSIEFQEIQRQLEATISGVDGTTPIASFNGVPLFQERAAPLVVTIGESAGQTMTMPDTNLEDGAIALLFANTDGVFDLDLESPTLDQTIRDGMEQVAALRASIGAAESRLHRATTAIQVQEENLTSAISRIRDVDMARETTNLARYNILTQAGTSMLAQANQTPQNVLRLLQ